MTNTVNKYMSKIVLVNQEGCKSDSFKPCLRSIIRDFASNTSIHGLPDIARSQSKYNYIFWSTLLLSFAGVMAYFVIESIEIYFEYPTQTLVSIVAERSQEFPAVTFCNYTSIRSYTLNELFLNYTESLNTTNSNDASTFTVERSRVLLNFFIQQLNNR